MSSADALRDAMRCAGLDYTGPIAADGKLHRFKAAEDRERNSYYVLHAGPPAAGAFGCWKRGINETWCERNTEPSQTQWNAIRKQWQVADAERKRVEKERRDKARDIAARLYDRAQPADASNAYLINKAVKASGDLRQSRDGKLIVPLRDGEGVLHSLQFIDGGGTKRFLTGGRIAGCFFTLADKSDGPLVICEGVATGASIHEATGFATVCAMNCGNLLAVAQALRAKWPTREIVIAGDDDAFTKDKGGQPWNPGLEKATKAAKAIRARLAMPQFTDTTTRPTDFNDLARLEGHDAIQRQIANTKALRETDEETFARLAELASADYDRVRESEAERLGIRVSTLDEAVTKLRSRSGGDDSTLQGRSVNLGDIEPWTQSVDGPQVLEQVAAAYSRYVALPPGAADALALWTAHTHCFEAFGCSPRLCVTSPEKGCGKTTLRDVLAVLVPRPLPSENLTAAVLFRVVEKRKPVVLADEYDTWIYDNEELRGMLNAGHKRGGQALRCEGDNHEVRAFNVFGPVVLCGLGALPGTLHDRSIVIRLTRAKPGELRTRFDSRRTAHEQELSRKLARWCADHATRLEAADPALPPGAFNRLGDNWRPLFAIAGIAGGDWTARAASAFTKLTNREDSDAQGLGVMLLADIRLAFAETHEERIFSKALVNVLCAMTERPWPEAHRGKPITETWLARRLKSFSIVSRNVRTGIEQAKGYELESFADAFARYLPTEGETKRPSVPSPANIGDCSLSEASRVETLGRIENAVSGNEDGPWDAGTDGKPGDAAKEPELAQADLI